MAQMELLELINTEIQPKITKRYYEAITNTSIKKAQVMSYIANILRTSGHTVAGYEDLNALTDAIYTEMAEYSILTPYLNRDDIEEININSWDDVALTYTDGRIEKGKHFSSPQHAIDIVMRLLQHSGMIIDNAKPTAQGHLPNNTRVTAMKTPIVDGDVGIAASIRLLHPARVNEKQLIEGDSLTRKMYDFLCMCLRYGVSFVIAGATASGKTTLLNALLGSIPNSKRMFTIESGARELSLVERGLDGDVLNNVVHTLSRPSEKQDEDISQEDLVVQSLRFNPDVVVVGEMRDIEAHAAVEAALTGHTVVSTIHAFAADAAHTRLAILCQKAHPIDFELTLMQVAQAFPLIVYEHKLEDNSRKVMSVCECIINGKGQLAYNDLFRYVITKNSYEKGEYHIEGHFEQCGTMSKGLATKLMQCGVPHDLLARFLTIGAP